MRLRTHFLTGAAACALIGGAAHAQEPPAEPIAITGENATLTPEGRIEASGDVEATYKDRVLKADAVVDDPDQAMITARGHVELRQPDGSVEFADSVVLSDDLAVGVARGFSARLPQNASVAADSVIKRNADVTELNRAIFTTCDICNVDGSPKTPTWSIRADKVVRDEQNQSINYRNAVIFIKGVPVLYTPFFSHADPSAPRKSGLLAPDFSITERRGLSYEQPYLWSISPYQDLVISPQINTEVAPFLNFAWRKRFWSGDVEARFGYTNEQDFNSAGVEFGPHQDKAYVLAAGAFEPNEDWRWGFTAEAAQDRRLFDQYSIPFQREDRGLFRADDRRLVSQLYAVRQTEHSYFSVAALGFQSLRTLLLPPNAFGIRPLEPNDILPQVAPLVEYRFDDGQVLGGRLRFEASGAAIFRDRSPVFAGADGVDSSRATAEVDWRSAFTFASGLRLEPFAHARGDLYSTSDLTPFDTRSHKTSRGIPTIGLDATWPLVRQSGAVTTVIEPIIQVAVSPDTKLNAEIPNEDSIAFDFDETNLFEFNKFPGFDLYEGGQRVNVGVATTVDWGGGRYFRATAGQSFRADPDPAFPARTGLDRKTSDWVVGAEATPIPGLSIYGRARLDDFNVQKIEAGFNADLARGAGYLRYMRQEADYSGVPREDVEGGGEFFVAKNWGISMDAVRDLEQKQWRRRAVGLVYRDDCLRFDLMYQRDNNPILGVKTSQSIVVRLTLATLGDTGYRDYSRRR